MKISYIKLHGCLFGSPVPNLQSQCYSTAPSDYEQVSSKKSIHSGFTFVIKPPLSAKSPFNRSYK